MDFIAEKCQTLLDEYDEFYCALSETLEGIAGSRKLKLQFEKLFLEIGGDEIYEKIITGEDFEIVFRNVLSSSLVKLSQLMTEMLDKRYAEIREKRMSVRLFMNHYLCVEEPEYPAQRRPTPYKQSEVTGGRREEEDDKVMLQAYNSNLYDSI